MRLALFLVTITALLLAAALVGCKSQPAEVTPPAQTAAQAPKPDIDIPASLPEAKDAKVLVQAFYPLNEGHAEVVAAVRGLEGKFKGKVRTEIYDIRFPDEKPEDFKKWQATGFAPCAGIMINDKHELMVDTGKGPETVLFEKAMGGMWTQEQLEKAVADAVKATYKG